jgi:diguanylate cyclase (GGDEF)-like protein/PAS domain S-box-containing protein
MAAHTPVAGQYVTGKQGDGKRMQVLIVIEDARFRGALEAFLASEGLTPSAASNLDEARDQLTGSQFGLVFLAERLGDLSPTATCAAIREMPNAQAARIVAVSPSKTPDYRMLIDAGFDDVVSRASTSEQIASQAVFARRPRIAAPSVGEAAPDHAEQSAAVTAELDVLRAERDSLAADRDALREQLDTIIAERDAATQVRDDVLQARDAAIAERDDALAARDTALQERDAALQQRDAAMEETAASHAVTQEFAPPEPAPDESPSQYLETLRTLGFYLARGTSVERQVQNALHAISGLLPSSRASVWLRAGDTGELSLVRASGMSAQYAEVGTRFYATFSEAALDQLGGESRFLSNLHETQEDDGNIAELVAQEGFASALLTGLATPTGSTGLLAVYLDDPGPLTANEVTTIEAIAAMTAVAIERARQHLALAEAAEAVADESEEAAAPESVEAQDEGTDAPVQQDALPWDRVINAMPNAAFLVDSNGRFASVNEPVANLVGFSADDLALLSIDDILADDDIDRVRYHLAGEQDAVTLPIDVKREGNRLVSAELRLRRLPASGGDLATLLIGTLHEKSDSERISAQLAAFQVMVQIMATERDVDIAMQGIVTALVERLGYNRAGIWTLDPEELLVARATLPPDAPQELPANSGIPGRVLAAREPELVADVLADPDYERVDESISSLICVPITLAERALGILQVESDASQPLEAQDLSFLVQLAAQIAGTLERSRLYQNLERQATVDLVTGLPNRQVFQQVLDRALANPRRGVVSVLIIGVDNFKGVNELYGHVIADDVLRQIGQVLNTRIQPRQTIARYISDQFAVLLPGVGRDEAVTIAEHLRIGVGIHLFSAAEQVEQLTVSIGAATCPDDAATPQALLQAADHAMYLAKRAGRNQTFQSNAAFATLAPAHGRINDLLRQSPRETLSLLIRAMDQRMPERAGHSERVTRYALAIAREMGVSDDELPGLRMAAYIHDIGMVSLPDALLRKPSQLSPEERDLLRGVPVAAHGLLSQLDLHESILLSVLHQRENWDGTGYPTGLRGESIPLGARIIAVADALDAMTSARAHREPMSLNAALEQVNRLAGTQFDPNVASAAYCLTDVISEPVSLSTADAATDGTATNPNEGED